MRQRKLLLLLMMALSGAPTQAQDQPMPPLRREIPRMAPPADSDQPLPPAQRRATPKPSAPKTDTAKAPPPLPTDPKARLDALFLRLQDAENPAAARKAEKEIERMFEQSGSATADLLFARAAQAFASRDYDTALDLLDYTLNLRPHFAEGFHRRAQVHLLRKDEEAALRDLKNTLAIEPRHFGAMGTLAAMLRSSGNKKGAFQLLSRLRDLNPHIPDIGEVLDKLRLDVEGQKI